MNRGRFFKTTTLLAGAFLLALVAGASAQQAKILTPDGTLFQFTTGNYGTLVPGGTAAAPGSDVILWTATTQSGQVQSGVIPGTDSNDYKNQLGLAYDSLSQSLFLVWNDHILGLNAINFAVYQKGLWVQSSLLPSGSFTFADNPQIAITHQTMETLDANGNTVNTPRSIISVIWWEDSVTPHARFAPIFIDPSGVDLSDVTIYDLPTLAGSSLKLVTTYLTNPVFEFPSLQGNAFGSDLLATFGDIATNSFDTLQIEFAWDYRHMDGGRHVIVILNHQQNPMPFPDMFTGSEAPSSIGTIIGGGYNPTIYWQNSDSSVSYSKFGGTAWGNVKTLALTPSLTLDSAVSLVRSMALQN